MRNINLVFFYYENLYLQASEIAQLASPRGSRDKKTSDSLAVTSTVSQKNDANNRTQKFNEMHLADLQKVFEAETDEHGALDKEGFIRVMKKVLSSMSEEKLEVLFLKVDSNCNGYVTWQKYVDYMMREFQGKEEMRKSQYRLRFHLPMTIIPMHHGSEIVKVAFLIQRFKTIGCFLTVTKDGILQFWSESFSMMNSFRLNQTQQFGRQQMWVVDMVCMHNMNLIAVASTELKIEFFDISNQKCVRAFTFIDLDSCVMVMDYWSDNNKGVFCYGDTKGNVVIFISDNVASGLFNPHILPRTSKWDHWTNVSLRKLLNEKSPLYRSFRVKNIRVWDLQDYVCLQSFCGKLFPLGNCPITSAYFHRDRTLICSTYNIGILRGYLESQGPLKTGKMTTHSTALSAVLYSKIFKQVVSGCLQGTVSVWDITTGKKRMEIFVSGTQQSELTAMSLDESERCVLTGLRDGTMQMWNYNTGECLLTFSTGDHVEISGIVHMNKGYYATGWSKRITNFRLHRTKMALSCCHWKTYHTEDVLCMAKYQNQFLGTSSYNGDILFWNVSMLKPILNFNASKSPLPLQPKKVKDSEECVLRTNVFPKDNAKKWAHKLPTKFAGFTVSPRLMSAPPVMRHRRESDQERRMSHKTRPRLPHTAAMLSSCTNGFIYAWSIHGNGGLLGKFPVDLEEDEDIVVGAMATDENDWILITGDSIGNIKRSVHSSGIKISTEEENKFRFLIPQQLQARSLHYIPQTEKEVVEGQTISLVPPPLLITWRSHLENVVDVLYVDIFQLVVSASEDGDVKIWKLSGDIIGTLGLNMWKRLKEATMIEDQEQEATLEEKPDFMGTTLKKSFLEMHKELAEALVYQEREQTALMAFLHGKEEKEAEALARLRQMAPISPWPKEHSMDDIEKTWNQWVKDKQVSKIVGAAYKPKEHVRNPKLLSTRVHYSWMRQQISPQIYQSLCFSDLKQVNHPDFLMHKVLDQQGRHIRWVASDIRSELESIRAQILMDMVASSTTAASPSSLSMLSLGASASRVVDPSCPTSDGVRGWRPMGVNEEEVATTATTTSEYPLEDPGVVAGTAMAGACSLSPLLVMLLAVVSASLPVTVIRLNKAALNYVSDIGKAPLQRALQVTVSDFLDRSGEVLQSTRVQILGVHLPRLHLKFIAGLGVHLTVAVNFMVKVFRVPEPMELVLPVALLADVHVARDSIGTLVLSISTCSSLFSPAGMPDGSNSTSQELLDLVQEHIKVDLSNKLCLQLSGLVQDLNVHLGTLIGLSPVGPESQIRYSVISTPTITNDYMSMDVRAILFLLGKPILLPLHGSHPFVLPWTLGDEGAMITVGLSQNLFDCALLMLQKAGSLNLEITGQLVAHQFPEPMPVVLKVQLSATPVATLHTNNSTLQLRPFIEVLTASPNSALQLLFSLDVMVNLNLQLSVSRAKLRGTTSMLGGVQLSVATSNVGSIDVGHCFTPIGRGNLWSVHSLKWLHALCTGAGMLWILCLVLCGLLAGTGADPGALLRLGMDIMNHEVRSAMEESHILEKMAAEASNPQAGGKAIKGLSNMKVKDVLEPVITLNFVPGVGIFQCVSTGMTITGKSFTGGNMEINVVLNITATNRLLKDEETGTPMFRSEGCEVILVSVKTNLPNNCSWGWCPSERNLSSTDSMPVNQTGTVKYALTAPPTTTASYIQVDFSVSTKGHQGAELRLGVAGVAASTQQVEPVVQLPESQVIQLATEGSVPEFPEGSAKGSQLLLSASFLTAELTLLQKSLDVNLKDKRVAKTYHKPKPLLIKVKISKPPKVTMKAGKSLMHLHGSLEMFAARRHSKHPKSLFLLETEAELTSFITDYLQKAYIPVVNDALHIGLPLPDLLAINYNLAELDIIEDALVLGLKVE
ncbi:BPI fold containing family B member 6 [Cricetulus griseus]